MTTWEPVEDKPPDVEHADVVIDVKTGELVIVLSQNEEDGVHELNELGEVIPPQRIHDLRRNANQHVVSAGMFRWVTKEGKRNDIAENNT